MTRTITRKAAAWLLVLAAVFGLAAECEHGQGGMWQGGGDSTPSWRR